MFSSFFYLLRDMGIPLSFRYIIEFYSALEKGLVDNLERLFLVMRLVFVKRVEHYDPFERAFAAYFLGKVELLQLPQVQALIESKPFQEWLKKQIAEGKLPADAIHNMSLEELMKKFWETLLAQQKEHHGGNRWVGTGGTSPWGHSGRSRGGIRVHGQSMHKSAIKVIGQRRYINYSSKSNLSAENIRQALGTLKRMVPVGPDTDLNIDKTLHQTCKNGGEIELVFDRELRDRIKVILLLDNGGYSMSPYVRIVRLLFSKIRDQFKDLEFYYFHNCIYNGVYTDIYRMNFLNMKDFLQKDANTRLFIVGDANMAPSELLSPYGAIDYGAEHPVPGLDWLKLLTQTFRYSVWLNPISKGHWRYNSSTIERISEVFHMEDLTLGGLKNAVEFLRSKDPQSGN